MNSHRRFEQLRQKLINRVPLSAGEATGDSVAKMLREIEEMANLKNPYCLPAAEVEQAIAELRRRIKDIKTRIETMWKPLPTVKFKDRLLNSSDFTGLSSWAISISFVGCRSKEWM
jgi:hypothetical protein